MQCGKEQMCGPCWDASPDEAWAICASVYELLGDVKGSVTYRDFVEATIGSVCAQTEVVTPNLRIRQGVEARIAQEGIETYPLTRMLTDMEVDE